ncbi:hypothetical protein RhiirA5_438147 [Rhizophagus irregularis]|uniref:Uncharacterized protein n=1 Tax=Rhizophagus irregularis TaxID=588596 RepID=A0A2N0NJH9_9GLOM|nr:hypothetical protein RhiirA5_438147 [Rhizophagus irregularis]
MRKNSKVSYFTFQLDDSEELGCKIVSLLIASFESFTISTLLETNLTQSNVSLQL